MNTGLGSALIGDNINIESLHVGNMSQRTHDNDVSKGHENEYKINVLGMQIDRKDAKEEFRSSRYQYTAPIRSPSPDGQIKVSTCLCAF